MDSSHNPIKTMTDEDTKYDAVLVLAFGGPEKPEDVRPYLMKVTRGRVPPERLERVARHYDLFGGKSPVNEITFAQAKALERTLKELGTALPVYVGMRNWYPLLEETVVRMGDQGVKRVVAVIMSVFQSHSSWGQYQDDLSDAIEKAGVDLQVAYTKPLYDLPGFVGTMADRVRDCLKGIPDSNRERAHLVFTAHSLPESDPQMALYSEQVNRSAHLISTNLGYDKWQIAFQSRSGRPQDPWLEPDVNHVLKDMAGRDIHDVVVVPIGFVCDNIEVLYDLDTQAKETADQAGIAFCRAKTVGDAPEFIGALADLVCRVE